MIQATGNGSKFICRHAKTANKFEYKKPFTAASHAHRPHHTFIAHRDLISARLSPAQLLWLQKLTEKLHRHARF
jgi:hypothetical protein